MLSLLKTVLTIFVFLVQFSSGAVIKRNGWPPYYPWWPWHSWPPPAQHTPTSTRVSISSFSSTATRFSPFPTTTSFDDDDSYTSFFPAETGTASPSPSSDDVTVTSSTAPTVTIPPTRSTSTKVPSTVQTTTIKPQFTQSATLSPTTTSKSPSSLVSGDFWKPTAGVTWQIQISGTVDTSIAADVYDVDLFDTPASTITALHTAGRKVICYFSAGSYEDWRPDQSSFQASDKGSAMQGWQGEWWLNTNSANVRSIMTKRIEMAASKGCDGVDPDNVDGYANANGLGIQEADAVDYLNFLASNAHSSGMAIGLKNAGGLIKSVLPIMQFAVNEQCEQFNECDVSQPFIAAGKPVLQYVKISPLI